MRGVQRLAAALAAAALLLALSPHLSGVTSAAFSGSTSNASTFGADTMAPPSTPLSVHKSNVGGMVGLSWTPSSSSYVTGYSVQRATTPGGPYTTLASIPLGINGFTEFSSGLTAGSSPWGITAGADGNLWFTENAANKIGRITPAGVITEYAIPTAASSPKGITAGPDGNVWFTEFATDKIGKITPAGVITEYPIPPLAQPARNPVSITAAANGNLYYTANNLNVIGQVTTAGVITEFTVGAAGNHLYGITSDPMGSLWVTENTANKLARVSLAGVVEYNVAGGSLPKGVTVGASGNVRIAQSGSNKIGKLTPYADAPAVTDTTAAGGPAEMTAGADGNVWYTESSGNKLASITTLDAITEYPIPTAASAPNGIANGPDGNIWFTEAATNKIGRYGLNLSTTYVDTTALYASQYYYRVVATYKSWTATGGTDMSLSLNPTSGTDRTPAAAATLTAANLTSLSRPDKDLLTPGAAWNNNKPYSTQAVRSLQWVDATTAFAFGWTGTILKSTNAGVDWVAQTTGTTNDFESGSCISASTCWAVGQTGTIRYTADGGTNWATQTAAPNANLTGVTAVDTTHVWAVGASGAIRFYNGTAWSTQTPAASVNFLDVFAVDATHVWAVGVNGAVQFFNGTSWALQTSPTPTKDNNTVRFLDASNGWMAGETGNMLVTTNGGTTWTAQTSNTTNHLWGLCFLDATHGWATGAAGTVMFYNGTTWAAQTADAAANIIQAVDFYDANTGLLGSDVANNPKLDLQLTQDGGATWISLEYQNIEVAFSPTVAVGAAITSVKATVMYDAAAAPAAAAKFWLLASYDAGATWKYYALPAATTTTTVATVDLSGVVNSQARLENLRLRFYASQVNNIAITNDLITVQVN